MTGKAALGFAITAATLGAVGGYASALAAQAPVLGTAVTGDAIQFIQTGRIRTDRPGVPGPEAEGHFQVRIGDRWVRVRLTADGPGFRRLGPTE